jgi:hypothetical protein
MSNPQGAFIWYELITPDPDGAKTFYDAVVGWTIDSQAIPGPIDYRMIVRSGGGHAGGLQRLTPEMAAAGGRPGWLGYIGVEDVDATATRIAAAGGMIIAPPTDVPGAGRVALVTDPQGAPFYIMRGATEGATSDVFSPEAIGCCGWNELVTSDQAAALGFYGDMFGYASNHAMPMGAMGDYAFLEHHGVTIGAMMPQPPGAPPPRWNFYFRVASIDAAIQAITAGGGRIINGPHEVPGGDHVLTGIDPQGAAFALVGKKA